MRSIVVAFGFFTLFIAGLAANAEGPPAGFVSLFNGKDLAGWKIPPGDNGHWKVVDGTIDCDARSESKVPDKSLWTDAKFKDFVLLVDWRFKTDEPGFMNPHVKQILSDGSHKKKPDGKDDDLTLEDVDSGIYVRGSSKSQVNIWMWPIGSGEVYGYRTDAKMPAEVRAAVTPKKKADKPRGEWNHFEITMKGDRLAVMLNGEEVISGARLPGVPTEGPIALQHHGSMKDGKWTGPPSLVQFRNIYIKELK
jgi:Domain of Unknown Function (DUF1080)